ncbi:MAG: ABC transporter substrate-binding protein [Pseudomonadota bacterium]
MQHARFPRALAWACGLVLAVAGSAMAETDRVEPRHGASMYGELKYGPDFTHFDYADPDAPKGGRVAFSAIGTFDSLNPYILRGNPAAGLGLMFDTLTVQSQDEPFAEYGLIARSIEMPEDRSWVAFELRPEARWHDGVPITADDVAFSLEILREQGSPFYRAYYANVTEVVVESPTRVRFVFDPGLVNRELPLIVGQMPILPKHYYEDVPFDRTTLTPPPRQRPLPDRLGRSRPLDRLRA